MTPSEQIKQINRAIAQQRLSKAKAVRAASQRRIFIMADEEQQAALAALGQDPMTWVMGILTYLDLQIDKIERPSTRLRPALTTDGNQWCVLYGDNLQDGIAGFGDTPEFAMLDFDENWAAEESRPEKFKQGKILPMAKQVAEQVSLLERVAILEQKEDLLKVTLEEIGHKLDDYLLSIGQ